MRTKPAASWTPFERAVHEVVQGVPRGGVVTYGDVAAAAGRPGAARAVGQVMRLNPDTNRTPCHRVVASNGTLGGYQGSSGFSKQKVGRLRAEGVHVGPDGRIRDFARIRWNPLAD